MIKLATWKLVSGRVEFGLGKQEIKGCGIIWKGAIEVYG